MTLLIDNGFSFQATNACNLSIIDIDIDEIIS